jgi:hypothetical protein
LKVYIGYGTFVKPVCCYTAYGEQKIKTTTLTSVDEGRKRVLLIAAAILAARKLSQCDGGKRVPATVMAISDAVRWAEEILKEIDSRWPRGNE